MTTSTDYDLDSLKSLVADLLQEARAQGATQAEAAVSMGSGLSVTVRMGEVETIEYNRDKGLGVTVYVGRRKGSASTTDFSARAIKETVAAACSIAKYTAEDPCAGLADAELMARVIPDLDLFHPWDVSAEAAIDIAKECEDAARAHDARITNSEGASVSSQQGARVYANSHGFVGAYPTTRHSLSISVIGEEGDSMQRDYWYASARDYRDLEAPAAIGVRAAQRTVRRLNGRRLSTRRVPVIFEADVASGLFGSFISAIRGGAQYRKSTFLLDSVGQSVFPAWLSLREDPHIKKGLASAPFDSEGVATRAHDLVHDGVVKSYVLDSYSARKLGLQTTGNAGGTHNVIVTHGADDLAALFRRVGSGLFVTELLGHGVNVTNGDYSRGASGFWVENGALQYPVEEITVAGNLKDMFRNIVAVGSDVDLRKNIRTGSVLIEQMTVAGE
jgi:PmbA protein